jgi:Holliday junction resolvase
MPDSEKKKKTVGKKSSRKAVRRRGYIVERKVRMEFGRYGWKTIRAGGSLGVADLICVKRGKCILLQVKSTKKKKFYYYAYSNKDFEGFPFYLVIDFGYGKIKIIHPKKIIDPEEGQDLKDFLDKNTP